MRIGVDYYPEQWDKAMWEKDAETMARTGVKLIRIGEFSWSRIEPREGEFDFTWLDDVIGIFSAYAIGTILCTPTNCSPLWLYEKYPEIIQVGSDGVRIRTGIRGHRCINSPVFRTYAKRVTEQMIRHYSGKPAVAAWQIDNELEAYPCSCDVCKGKFRDWLLDKYNDLDGINKAFGNSVWSGEYSSITQIQPPTDYPQAWQNPALCLDWYRFRSDSAADFVRDTTLTIRLEDTKVPITTNAHLCRDNPDFYKLFDLLDFVSFDNYPPVNIPADPDEYYSHAFYLDLMRGIKDRNFCIMEQLSGPTGCWTPMSPAPRSGMIMGYALQAFVRGADTVLHFRWRTALTGAEMYWHGILDHSNTPNRRFLEFSDLCKKVAQLNILDNTYIVSDAAIIYSPEAEAAFRIQPQTEGFSYIKQLTAFHSALTKFGANIDVVPSNADLSRYKLVIAPSLHINKKESTENLYRYVINGGTLVLTARSGVKDEHNNCIMDTLPTVFKELIGADVAEYDPIGNGKRTIRDFAGNEYECSQWCDIMRLSTARAYAEYNDGEYRCMPSVTMNRYCNGVAYYVGTICRSDFYEDFVSNLMMQTGIPKLKGLPRGVEVTTRTNSRDEYICFFNNSEESAVIPLPKPMYSIISSIGKDKLELRPFEMDIVRK